MSMKRGTLYLVAAWSSMMLTGYILNVWLGRYFGPEGYGIYGLVISVLMWMEIFVITGLPYSVQKFIASNEEEADSILWTAFQFQFVFTLGLTAICLVIAPLLASLFEDTRLNGYFRVAFLNVFFYGMFHIFVSFQNGKRRFGKQAWLLVIYSTGKLCFVLLFVLLFRSLMGAFLANAAASLIGLGAGYYFLGENRRWRDVEAYDAQALIRFATPTLIYSLMINLLLYIDLWMVRYFWPLKINPFGFASIQYDDELREYIVIVSQVEIHVRRSVTVPTRCFQFKEDKNCYPCVDNRFQNAERFKQTNIYNNMKFTTEIYHEDDMPKKLREGEAINGRIVLGRCKSKWFPVARVEVINANIG